MNEDVEDLLLSVTPRGAPARLRGPILEAVADALRSPPPRRFPIGAATAAAVAASIVLNVLVVRDLEVRLDRAFAPRTVSPPRIELADEVAEFVGPAAGRWVRDRDAARHPPRSPADLRRQAREMERILRELTFDPRESAHETPQDIPQAVRDRRRARPGDILNVACRLLLDHRPTA